MRRSRNHRSAPEPPRFPGVPAAVDGSTAIVEMETAASDAAGAYPITPSTQMGEGWAAAVAAGKTNVNGRRLLFFEPEGEHAAAAVTTGMNLTGLRSANFSSGQGIAYMHESLYAAVGKRLTYVLNVACRAMTKHALNVHAGHDDYHAVDDTGFFQLFAKDVQEAADLNLIAHRVAELALNPGICAQDGFLTSHVVETVRLPERALIREYLGDPADEIESPTPAQRMVFGEHRRRIPALFDVDYPAMLGVVQNQDSYAQGVAAQRPFYFDHVAELTDGAMREYGVLTGRRYARAAGYRLEDAEYVIAGQGSVVSNAEAVVDHLRATRGLKVGVLNVTMFRPFPADLISHLLRGKKAVTVMERLDQPLAVDPPLLREIRAAMSQALENAGVPRTADPPFPGLARVPADAMPIFLSACFGLGSRDLQPGDLIAVVENMLSTGAARRRFYVGIDFVRDDTRLPKLQIWQEQLLDAYPHLRDLALRSAGDVDLLPPGSTSIRVHSVGGWGAITMGKNLAMTASDLLGLHLKANPKYGSEKKGQPTTFYATLADEPIRLNCELKHVNVVLSPDPNVFGHGNALAGLCEGGVFVIQSTLSPEGLWESLPRTAQRAIRQKNVAVYHLDAFAIAEAEASNPDLRYRMQGAAFMGAFFRVWPKIAEAGLEKDALFTGVRKQLEKKFGHLGEQVVDDNYRVILRGYEQVAQLDVASFEESGPSVGPAHVLPMIARGCGARPGIADPGRFWEQVGHLYTTGDDGIADPFVALSAVPAATSTIRDMTDVRFEVPEFHPSSCTGCGQCWVQCPDTAIPGLVSTAEDVIAAAIAAASNGTSLDRMRQATRPLAREVQRVLRSAPFTTFGDTLRLAYEKVAPKLAADAERRAQLDAEFAPVALAVAEFPLAKTAPFFDVPEGREKGAGGLLSITVNPQTCKGCNICVEVCPDGALTTVRQDPEAVEMLRRNWELWEHLPDTDDRFVAVTSVEEGIGVLSSLLLKRENYRSMMGGDGACMGCGEKTALHLVLSAVNALVLPRVKKHVARLDDLIARLDATARALLASDADLDAVLVDGGEHADVPIDPATRPRLNRITTLLRDVRDLRWRYTEGPSGKGRAAVGFANSTGCSSVWGSTYPYNPYPFPWVNHLFQDAPSVAIGLFEGHMRSMADDFATVRRAELELDDAYDADEHERFFTAFDWQQFSDEEFGLCPPIFAVGGDGAMLDIGFQNVSRLLASGKPIRVVMLDTQVYSNTGGQACTSGFLGQVSDMAAFGAAHHGKEEIRKEMALLAIAHRGAFVLQSSQAAPSHLLGGVLRGLQTRRPSMFVLHCPCPPEHGVGDDAAVHQARLALESRAFPLLVYDPDAGATHAECLDLDGNPAQDSAWPEYDLVYVNDDGAEETLHIPLTIADWAATEGRFKRHFQAVADDVEDDELVPFHAFLELPGDEREGLIPFIQALDDERRLTRVRVSPEIVELAAERLQFWHQLRQMAGDETPEDVRGRIESELESAHAAALDALRAESAAQLSAVQASYPALIARKLAEGLLRAGAEDRTVAELLADAADTPGLALPEALVQESAVQDSVGQAVAAAGSEVAPSPAVAEPLQADAAAEEEEDDDIALEPYIESARCTACNECTAINAKLFAYDDKKRAFVKDASAGTFRQIVTAAERCPVRIIHPGAPLNSNEKDLAKWVKRAEPFN